MKKPTKKTFNYFERVTVDTDNFADCALSWDFISAGIALLNEGTTGNIIQYSFDGITVHGDLNPGTSSAGVIFDNRHQSKVYFRIGSGSSADVRFEAWA